MKRKVAFSLDIETYNLMRAEMRKRGKIGKKWGNATFIKELIYDYIKRKRR